MSTQDVEAYYDANTASFLKTGQGGTAIRRAVWGPGVTDRAEAFRFIDRRVLELIRASSEPSRRVVDLGCGVGASLAWLRTQAEFEGLGLTVSGEQVAAAQRLHASVLGLRFLKANYTELPDDVRDVDVAFAIESFVNAPSVESFIAPIAARLRPGGVLVICDDFAGPQRADHVRALDDFRFGWLATTLATPDEVSAVARAHGLSLSADVDLTSWLELDRPRDRLIALAVRLLRPFGRRWLVRSWIGGSALQTALVARALEYRVLTFVKS